MRHLTDSKPIETDEQFCQFVYEARHDEATRLVNDDVAFMLISVEDYQGPKETKLEVPLETQTQECNESETRPLVVCSFLGDFRRCFYIPCWVCYASLEIIIELEPIMLWPSQRDYAQAVDYYPHISILDPELRGGNPRRGFNNYLMVYTGGFSIVFPIEVSSSTYALRCWITNIRDAETRYREIADYLRQCRLPYFVDFAYVPEGIFVNGHRYPITRMEWVEGETLCDFIEHNLQDAICLETAAVEFQKMVAALHAHQISHGDLQDGNILLKRNGADVEIKLIDYDSVFVPALRGHPDTIVGVPAYQHPQRIARGVGAAEKMDYFSELVIYLSLLSLAEKPDLWSQFGAPTERRLLFIAEDFKNPDQSDVFRELENLSPDVKQLASKL